MRFQEQLSFKTNSGIRSNIVNIRQYPFHSHQDYIEIICILDGKVKVFDSAETYLLSENDVHLFNFTIPHKIISITPQSTLLMLHIDKTKFAKSWDKLYNACFVVHSTNKSNMSTPEINLLRFYMANVYKEYTQENASAIKLDNLANQIISLLYEQFHDYAYEKIGTSHYNIVRKRFNGKNEDQFYRIYRIADYIEANHSNNITLSEIANIEHLSPTYLTKYIKDNIGITFSNLVSIIRCSYAARILATSTKALDIIAQEVGFANRSHLFTNFKKWYSISPSKYRKMIIDDLSENILIEYGEMDFDNVKKIINQYLNA